MEIKKYPHADLGRYRGLIFSLSLLTTMSLVVTAFEWNYTPKAEIELDARNTNTFEEVMEVPRTEIEPLPPAPVSVARLVEVPDEEKIEEEIKVTFDIEMSQDTRVQEFVMPEVKPEEKENVDEIFMVVETPAAPKGGFGAFYQDIGDRIRYPAPARRMRIEGKVFVEFVINRDGSIQDVRAVKGIGAGCDEEAVRVIQTAPEWVPARQRGKTVRQRMVLPITFKLAN
jgi:protein TonB